MKKTIVLFLLISAVSAPFLFAEEETPTVFTRMPSALGAVWGDVSGTGLSYHLWLGKLGVSAAAGVYYSNEEMMYVPGIPYEDSRFDLVHPETGKVYPGMGMYYTSLWYNLGLEAQYKVYEEDFAGWFSGCLYLFFGLNHNARAKYSYDVNWTESTEYPGSYSWEEDRTRRTDYPVEFNVNTGLGIGIELVLFGHFSFPMEFGYVMYMNNMKPDLDHIRVQFMAQTGFRYRF